MYLEIWDDIVIDKGLLCVFMNFLWKISELRGNLRYFVILYLNFLLCLEIEKLVDYISVKYLIIVLVEIVKFKFVNIL